MDDEQTKAIRRFLAANPHAEIEEWYRMTEEQREYYRNLASED